MRSVTSYRRGVVSAVVFVNIVLDERIGSPTINGEVRVATRVESAFVVNGPGIRER